ncbi:rifin [Plasmodium falciparum RAJ116]|uniref:Rifin n=1 Tax=Plasmodium falciparum RAJ116 TaxID=580058 RepID=A0A0L0CTL9_PLAFA|nr:rifin [Plasmodium falciparum RAJ116]
MKLHYTTMLLFCFPLNVLAHNKNKAYIIPRHTRTSTSRVLRECDTSTSVYDNDPEMKSVKENFDRQTSHRFEEYEERMNVKRQKCKEQCDKEIQKIILKDKLEKELMDKFATLHTDMQSDAIPTCVCEKSVADKTEKFCLNCGVQLGGGVLQASGLLGGIGEAIMSAWKVAALKAAARYAASKGAAEGLAAGKAAGMNVINVILEQKGIAQYCPNIFQSIQKIKSFTELKTFSSAIVAEHDKICAMSASVENPMCLPFDIALRLRDASGKPLAPPANEAIPKMINGLAGKAKGTADFMANKVSSETYSKIITKQADLIEAGFNSCTTSIYASIIVILIIVLIMVIIYLILRYRRKKKMKKKLQYIKLLEE